MRYVYRIRNISQKLAHSGRTFARHLTSRPHGHNHRKDKKNAAGLIESVHPIMIFTAQTGKCQNCHNHQTAPPERTLLNTNNPPQTGGKVTGKRSTAVCKFLGDISYPVYITHYPLVYTYTAWVCNNNATLAEGIPYMILTFAGAFVLAYACLKLYDEPIRKWLTDRFLKGKKAVKS